MSRQALLFRQHGIPQRGALCLDANDGEAPAPQTLKAAAPSRTTARASWEAIYAAGKDAACQTERRSTPQTPPPHLFSGNYRGRTVGTSSGGGANSITVMGNVSMVMQAEQNCLISMEDPIYPLQDTPPPQACGKRGPVPSPDSVEAFPDAIFR